MGEREVVAMAKRICLCGQAMYDHNAPDGNFYRVFSDVEWNIIETDDNGNLNFVIIEHIKH